MNVKLIALSKPVIQECETAGDLIAYCARVSNPRNQANSETAPRLLRYLASHQHWSPFEMAHMVLEITTTRDIARQILRHRSFSFQEFSGRYAEFNDALEFREARIQDTKNRQNSLPCDNEALAEEWLMRQSLAASAAQQAYRWALDHGIAKEQARAVLAEGMTVSRLYMAGTVRSWLHYIAVRTDPATQTEHREIAERCKQVLLEQFPALADVV